MVAHLVDTFSGATVDGHRAVDVSVVPMTPAARSQPTVVVVFDNGARFVLYPTQTMRQ